MKETIEEFAERIARGYGSDNWVEIMEGIIEGAKWQQEQNNLIEKDINNKINKI
jgi:hypothetical protein